MTTQDKRYQEYREACAKVDGFKNIRPNSFGDLSGTHTDKPPFYLVPTYLDDASIDAVVRKLDDEQLPEYAKHLALVILGKVACMYYETDALLQALPEQKAEALARTIMGEVR